MEINKEKENKELIMDLMWIFNSTVSFIKYWNTEVLPQWNQI